MTRERIPPPEPGLHYDVPDELYRQWDAVSQTLLKAYAACPAKAKWADEHPSPPTEAQLTGRVCHTATFEPHRFDELYVAHDKPDCRTKKGKEEWAELTAQADESGKTIITMRDYNLACWTRDAVRAHPAAAELLVHDGDAEVSAVWYGAGEHAAEPYKARFDWLPKSHAFIFDLKTARSVEPHAFQRAVLSYGYHVQAAMYLCGYEMATGNECATFYIVAVEKHPPNVVSVFKLDDSLLDDGRDIINCGAEEIVRCRRENHWPGYSDKLETLTLPEWAQNGDEDVRDDEDGNW